MKNFKIKILESQSIYRTAIINVKASNEAEALIIADQMVDNYDIKDSEWKQNTGRDETRYDTSIVEEV